ncbi:MAG: TspO protein [Novosphingobium sp. 28-62-57]|uniref:TspO/MBR family protein n=1 Tax=unclassified Novosphingobium TaxID=2644732 RepID=UPI000BD69C0E|nr:MULTISPECIES: TspO/MBR family protein [unclassified Novosphingobium]OYW49414.1 MAG: TspO protein [Novosphingobium sp. 12-62-10]OYZ09167.1 MAG: TspO protein [Novosphingobium sp. 28-62-57]OZA34656.1 MAG: TspO protein [Novosphingobium sp. 17-62-9]HQS68331.1 tryptophan-rich sensory protein [Novosphingobium sp.]
MTRAGFVPIGIASLAALGVAMLGGTITDLGPWYESLAKPSFNPPRPVFPIAWTTIFALTAVAGVTAWRAAKDARTSDTVIGLFALNGFLNLLWSLLFFRVQRPDLAFYELIVLWLSIALLIVYCSRLSRLAAVMLLPYIVWVTAAGVLNWEIVRLNAPFG